MSGARTVTVYDIQQKHPWVEEEAPGEDMRETDGGCHLVRWHTDSTLESAAVNVEEVRAEFSHIAMFYVTVWFGGVGTSVFVRDPISLAFFINQTVPGLRPFMKEHKCA